MTFEKLLTLANTALIQKSIKMLNSFDLETLESNGFYRDAKTYSYVFQYPPSTSLSVLSEDQIVSSVPENALKRKLGLYVHIPYCTGSCTYCYFAQFSKSVAPIEISEYLSLVKDEIDLTIQQFLLKESEVTSVAFGGGTPTCMSIKDTKSIMSWIYSKFKHQPDVEVSFEASPETITGENSGYLFELLLLNVNRISIGIQSFEDKLLKSLKRRHNSEIAINAMTGARQAGFSNINIDLMYGLPAQTLLDWEATLCKTTDLAPESISLYRLRIHPDSQLANIKKNEYPDEEMILVMYMMGVFHFTNFGYIQASSHLFVLNEKFIQKHVTEKQGINDHELLGVGLSAYSYMNKYFYWNHFSMADYKKSIESEKKPVAIGIKLSEEEQQRKTMVLGMHEYGGVSRHHFKNRFGIFPEDLYKNELDRLIALDLMDISEDKISLMPKGLLFADEICTEFYSSEVKKKIAQKGAHRYGINYVGKDYENTD